MRLASTVVRQRDASDIRAGCLIRPAPLWPHARVPREGARSAWRCGGDHDRWQGRERLPVQVLMPVTSGDDPHDQPAPGRQRRRPQVPLGQCEIQFGPGPPMIRSEGGYLYDQVSIDVRDGTWEHWRDAQGAWRARLSSHRLLLRWSVSMRRSAGQGAAPSRRPAHASGSSRCSCISRSVPCRDGDCHAVTAIRLVGGVWIMWLLDYNRRSRWRWIHRTSGVAAEPASRDLIYLDHAWEAVTQGGRHPTLAELVAPSSTRGQPRAAQAHDGARHHGSARAGRSGVTVGGERDEAESPRRGGREW